jgi:hypothetical protein
MSLRTLEEGSENGFSNLRTTNTHGNSTRYKLNYHVATSRDLVRNGQEGTCSYKKHGFAQSLQVNGRRVGCR